LGKCRMRSLSVDGRRKIGWGGRIRTFTILINSEVSYRLDHAPAGAKRRNREPSSVTDGYANAV
jgi:hypothetical protein